MQYTASVNVKKSLLYNSVLQTFALFFFEKILLINYYTLLYI